MGIQRKSEYAPLTVHQMSEGCLATSRLWVSLMVTIRIGDKFNFINGGFFCAAVFPS
jgi:hypothetical protein